MNFLFKRLGECTFWAHEFCLWENIILTREHWKMPQLLMNYSTELKFSFFWGVNKFIKLHGTYSNMFSLFGALSFSFFFLPQLDVLGQNYISRTGKEKSMFYTQIEHVAFSDNGLWMATVERRDNKQTTPELRLKFWEYETTSQRYSGGSHLSGIVLVVLPID